MSNNTLHTYVTEQLALGVEAQSLKKALLDAGWSKKEVDAALPPTKKKFLLFIVLGAFVLILIGSFYTYKKINLRLHPTKTYAARQGSVSYELTYQSTWEVTNQGKAVVFHPNPDVIISIDVSEEKTDFSESIKRASTDKEVGHAASSTHLDSLTVGEHAAVQLIKDVAPTTKLGSHVISTEVIINNNRVTINLTVKGESFKKKSTLAAYIAEYNRLLSSLHFTS